MEDSYTAAGVNIDVADRAKALISRHARTTRRPGVLGDIGFFGGLFEVKGYREPVLVASVDGVGTKLKIAAALGRHNTVGIDLVNHCVNDILTLGAEPLFFLDYIGTGRLVPETAASVVEGMAQACREAGCALIGGETAQMPGLYSGDDYDLVGFIVGVVEKTEIITGGGIRAGDSILGLPSSGLHTNGYSLARKIFGDTSEALGKRYPGLERSVGEELLEPHRCYYRPLKPLLAQLKGMAHITGGGLVDNVPRVLPEGLAARFDSSRWAVPEIFRLIQEKGNVARAEMFRVFNMGIGMVLICAPERAAGIQQALPESRLIGEVVARGDGAGVVIE